MSSNKREAHIDITTLLGTIDALNLYPEVARLPKSRHHIHTLAQFVEALVLQDGLKYEFSTNPFHAPYTDLVEGSGLSAHLEPGLLVEHLSPNHSEHIKQEAVLWALEKAPFVPQKVIDFSVSPRNSIYRGIELTKGIKDNKSQYINDIFDTAKDVMTEEQRIKLTKADKAIGRMGLHIIARLYMLNLWLAQKNTVYVPHYSRTPLSNSTLVVESTSPSHRYIAYSIAQLKKHLPAIIEKNTMESERIDLDLAVSPIFTACLVGARYPLDIIDNALKLRSKRSAKRLRQACRNLEENAQTGVDPSSSMRKELREAIEAFASDAKDMAKKNLTSLSIGTSGISIRRTLSGVNRKPGVGFFIHVLNMSMQVYNMSHALSEIFESIEEDNYWILEAS